MKIISKNSSKKSLNNIKIGENVKIYDYVNAYQCEIGDNSKIGAFVEIQKGSIIGKNCKVSSHSFICDGVEIEDNCFIGHGVMFTNDLFPRATNKDGSTTYFYRRSEDEPEKNIQQIKKLIENPPNMKKYQDFIRKAFLALTSNDIRIQIIDPNNDDLSGQWLYKKKKILINKNSLVEGSKYFAYLLSHEMLHVSQSCKGGGFGSYPVLLGLRRNESSKFYLKKLQKPVYENLKSNEIQLEIEAYSNEKNIDKTLKAFKYFCLKQK